MVVGETCAMFMWLRDLMWGAGLCAYRFVVFSLVQTDKSRDGSRIMIEL